MARPTFAEIFAWNRAVGVSTWEMAIAGLAMLLPAAALAAAGALGHGMVAALGGLAMSGPLGVSGNRGVVSALAQRFAAIAAATVTAAFAADLGAFTTPAVILAAVMAAAGGGYSRVAAEFAGRYIVFLVIAVVIIMTADASGAADAGAFLVALILVGAALAAVLIFADHALRLQFSHRHGAMVADPGRQPTADQRRNHLRRSLATPAGWQFPIRLGLCLAIGGVVEWLFPGHRFHWVMVSVAILLQRQPDPKPTRPLQRGLGAVAGVAVTALLASFKPGPWLLVAMTGLLAGLRPLLLQRNYVAYSVLMTPLVMLVLDGGVMPDAGLLADRLVATALAAILVTGVNWAAIRLIGAEASSTPAGHSHLAKPGAPAPDHRKRTSAADG